MPSTEYAAAGVDYTKIEPFKREMQRVGRRTLDFPRTVRNVEVASGDHGALYRYTGNEPHSWCQVTEGLGNKNWIAEWMRQYAGTDRTYYDGIGIDTVLMATNDLIAQGAMPVLYTDEVAAGDSDWFQDEKRAADLANSFFEACKMLQMALPAGESPALRYLVRAEPPVKSAPSLSGCATGIIAPHKPGRIPGSRPCPGDLILGAPSSGIHANGISLVIKKALELPDQFLTKLPNGRTLGEEALIPTRSYHKLVQALLDARVKVSMFLPATGSGVSKIAFRPDPLTYWINHWVPEIPPIFHFMRELGVPLKDLLTTFNWGVGYYVFVPPSELSNAMEAATDAGVELYELGHVEQGERKVAFMPHRIILSPPGE